MIIAVTGKMASGKNYICSQMQKDGWFSVDADLLVHSAIETAKDKIFQTFKPYAKSHNIVILTPEGNINRRALGKLLFAEPKLLQMQEDIVYPIITNIIEEYIKNHEKLIINATVLYKTPAILNRCEKIIFVTSPFFKRLKRAKKRDNLPYSQILRRFWTQRNLLKEYKKFPISLEVVKN